MILSDTTLQKMISRGKLIAKDKNIKIRVNPASIDLHLGDHYLTVEDREMSFITLDQPIRYREIKSDNVTIPAHHFLLATTKEYVKLPPNITAFVEGRSSIGRIGLFIQNAGWIDPGFEGRITLELYNANSLPINLRSNTRICQIVFCKIDKAAKNPYRGKYQGQTETVGSRIYLDKEFKK